MCILHAPVINKMLKNLLEVQLRCAAFNSLFIIALEKYLHFISLAWHNAGSIHMSHIYINESDYR